MLQQSWQCRWQCSQYKTLQQGRGGHSQHWWGSMIAICWRSFSCCFWPGNTWYEHRVILHTSLGEEEKERKDKKKRASLSRKFYLKIAFLKICQSCLCICSSVACNLTPYGKTSTSQNIATVGAVPDNAKWPGKGITNPPNPCEVTPGSFGV